jgi:hypothetical protein
LFKQSGYGKNEPKFKQAEENRENEIFRVKRESAVKRKEKEDICYRYWLKI